MFYEQTEEIIELDIPDDIILIIEEEVIEDEPIIVVEDIVDTGNTISEIIKILEAEEVASYRIATLCYKPEAYKKSKGWKRLS